MQTLLCVDHRLLEHAAAVDAASEFVLRGLGGVDAGVFRVVEHGAGPTAEVVALGETQRSFGIPRGAARGGEVALDALMGGQDIAEFGMGHHLGRWSRRCG